MNVTLSVVNYNTKDLTKSCLKTILADNWSNKVKIWVVDNASSDGSTEMIKDEFSNINLFESDKNLGFGAGHNIIFKKERADYYFIVNSDCEVKNGTIKDMITFMEDNPNCGIASCKIVGFDGKLQPNGGDEPNALSIVNWLFNLEAIGIKKPMFHQNDKSFYTSVHEVGWVSGSFMVVRGSVLEKIGFFDESYFMYFEDVDLCFRAKNAGFSIMLNTNVIVKHLSGGSLDNPKLRQWIGEYKGLIIFYKKNFGKLASLFIELLVYISSILRIISFALFGKLNISKTYAQVIINL